MRLLSIAGIAFSLSCVMHDNGRARRGVPGLTFWGQMQLDRHVIA
jgi:hypothetical protein